MLSAESTSVSRSLYSMRLFVFIRFTIVASTACALSCTILVFFVCVPSSSMAGIGKLSLNWLLLKFAFKWKRSCRML